MTVICAGCGTAGHTMGRCPDREQPRLRLVERPRRCVVCDGPVLVTDGGLVDDHGTPHDCPVEARSIAVA